MRARKLVLNLILVLAVLIIVGNCATSKKVLSTDNNDELVGTWVNPEYENRVKVSPKIIFTVDGTILYYGSIDDKGAPLEGKITEIGEKWMERDGSIFYKFIEKIERYGITNYTLLELSPDRSFIELVFRANPREYPSEIDPENSKLYYRIYYRQE
jgi:hypothetical protein